MINGFFSVLCVENNIPRMTTILLTNTNTSQIQTFQLVSLSSNAAKPQYSNITVSTIQLV